MINGNSVILQFGKESAYGTEATCTRQIQIASESLKPEYNKVDEGLATGGRGAGRKSTMGIGTSGSISTLLRPDMAFLIAHAMGVENVSAVTGKSGAYKHVLTAIGTDETLHLPSATIKVDRKVNKLAYVGQKINQFSIDVSAGAFAKLDIGFVGKDEIDTGVEMETGLTPSSIKAFKLAQAKAYVTVDGTKTEIADVDSINLTYNNNLDAQVQTTSTGDYYKEAECGVRDVQATMSMIYAQGTEAIRKSLYKSDKTFSVELDFVSDELVVAGCPYSLTVSLPCCQMPEAEANMGGLETLKQNVTVSVVDDLVHELATFEFVNGESASSIADTVAKDDD